MCIPEIVFFDDEPRSRPGSRGRDPIRPLSAASTANQPLLSSPPFVVQVSPKLGRNNSRRPPIHRQTAPQPKREEREWREGFRAGQEAVQKKNSEQRERKVGEINETAIESQAKRTPEINTVPKPRAVSLEEIPEPAPAPAQPSHRRATSAAQFCPPAPSFPPPVVLEQPLASQMQPAHLPLPVPQLDSEPYIYEHRLSHQSDGRPRSPSNDSTSSRSLRALKRRLSNIWAHVAGLERWAIDEDTRERRDRRDRERREADVRRTRQREEAERRRKQNRAVRFESDGRTRSGGKRMLVLPPPRRVVVVDKRSGARDLVDTWEGSRWN